MNWRKVFLSSEGDGKVAKTWKGAAVLLIMWVTSQMGMNVPQESILGLVEALIQAGATIFTAYGALRKVMNRRWSA